MATRRLSLILALRDHRSIIATMNGMANEAEAMAIATGRQRVEVEALETAYRRLSSTISGTANMTARLPGGGGGGGMTPGPSGGISPGGSGGGGGGGFMDRLKSVYMANRSGLAGGGMLQNVASRSLHALGVASNPAVLAATAAIAVAVAFHKLATASAAVTNEFARNQIVSGGSAYDTARLGSMGISGEASRGTLDRITGDGAAMGVAAKYGVSGVAGPYGTMNSADATIKLIEGLRTESGEQQKRDMRILGLEGFGGLLKVSDETFNLLKRDAATRAAIMNPRQQRNAAEFDVSGNRLKESWGNLTTVAGAPLVKAFTEIQNVLATQIDHTAMWLQEHSQDWNKLLDPLIPQWLKDALDEPEQKGAIQATEAETRKENTDALRRLNQTFQQSERANRASPDALRGMGFHKALAANALPQGTI